MIPSDETAAKSLKEAAAGADTSGMALLPFSRQGKKRDEETAVDGSNQVAEFFSNDPRSRDSSGEAARPDQMTERQTPAMLAQDHAEPGWYPDAADPGMMRYWDGFHMTGQTVRVDPTTASAEEAPQTAEPPSQSATRVSDLLAPPRSPFPPESSSVADLTDRSAPAVRPLPTSVPVDVSADAQAANPGIPSTADRSLPGQPAGTSAVWTTLHGIDDLQADEAVEPLPDIEA